VLQELCRGSQVEAAPPHGEVDGGGLRPEGRFQQLMEGLESGELAVVGHAFSPQK
jgi:hypothetical protein